jgi:Zn-dependent protease with chaperone function
MILEYFINSNLQNRQLQYINVCKYIYINAAVLFLVIKQHNCNYFYVFIFFLLFFSILGIIQEGIKLLFIKKNRGIVKVQKAQNALYNSVWKSIAILMLVYFVQIANIDNVLFVILLITVVINIFYICRKVKRNESKRYNNIFKLSHYPDLHKKVEDFLLIQGFQNIEIYYYFNETVNAHLSIKRNNHQIILSSSALDKLDANEIISLIGHEIGHVKERRLLQFSSGIMINVMLLLFFYIILKYCTLQGYSMCLSIVLCIAFCDIYMLFIKYIKSCISRAKEYMADRYSCAIYPKEYLISALRKADKLNVKADLRYYIFNCHPLIEYRIRKIKTYHDYI